MKRFVTLLAATISALAVLLAAPDRVLAQETKPEIIISTTYPSQVVELGESITIKVKVESFGSDRVIQLGMDEIPAGWNASFRGGGRIIHSVFVEDRSFEMIDLRLDPPQNPISGEFTFVVLAEDGEENAKLPITLSVQDKVPGGLEFSIDLPTIKGSPTTTFRYSAKLKNTGDEEILVNLTADTPFGFRTKFKLSGQETTSFPLGANQAKTISIELDPIAEQQAGKYAFSVNATGGDMQASLDLEAEVTGQHDISVTGTDGRLSGKATAGKGTALPILITNKGTAAALGIEMSANAPAGWTVEFDPEVIPEVPAGDQVEVKATIIPAEKAVAGDYMVTIKAKPIEGARETADFRITVTTSTLWGVAGIALVAVAVGVVAIAVTRFGRR